MSGWCCYLPDCYVLWGFNPTFLCSVPGLTLLVYACLPCLSPNFLGGVALHSLGLYGDAILGLVFMVGAAVLGSDNL